MQGLSAVREAETYNEYSTTKQLHQLASDLGLRQLNILRN